MTNVIPYPLELVTERLVIRSPLEGDAKGLKDAIEESLEYLKPWMVWADHAPTLAETEENCAKAVQDFKDGKDYRLHFFLKESNIFLGGSGLHRIDWAVPKFEIGYWVRQSYSGYGYVSEAVEGISRYAFDELCAKRVEITMSTENKKSWRVAEGLGFVLEGTLRNECRNVDGSLRDTRIYAKIARNEGRQSSAEDKAVDACR